jgi:peptidoglycan/LPS O-acetylase OafA/YrhL
MSLQDQQIQKESILKIQEQVKSPLSISGNPVLNKIQAVEKKYEIIQAFRFIAAFMVIILHSTFYTSERLDPNGPIYAQGHNGVRLFFVISGFVMIVSSESLKKLTWGWKIFAEKRILRIVPIYWIITSYKLLVLVFASTLVYHAKIDVDYILKSYFFIPAKNIDGEMSPLLGVGWTLNFEMFFYFLFAVALAFRVNAIAFLSAIFIPVALLSILKTPASPDISFYADPIIIDFLFGMIAAKLILSSKKIPSALSIAFIITGLLYLFLPKIEAISSLYVFDKIAAGIASFMVIYGGVCLEKNLRNKIPSWLIYLGGASYSLYLIHPISAPLVPAVLNFLHLKWTWLSIVLSILTSLTAGTLFYKYCEKPLTQYLSRRIRKPKTVAVAV